MRQYEMHRSTSRIARIDGPDDWRSSGHVEQGRRMALHRAVRTHRRILHSIEARTSSVSSQPCPGAPPLCIRTALSRTPQIDPHKHRSRQPKMLVSGLCICKEARTTPVLGGGGFVDSRPYCATAFTKLLVTIGVHTHLHRGRLLNVGHDRLDPPEKLAGRPRNSGCGLPSGSGPKVGPI
jgi:hypothetical protein